MEEENSASGLYRPHMGAQTQSLELPRIDQCEPIHGMDDSQLVGVPVVVAGDSAFGRVDAASKVDVEVKAEVNLSEGGGGKRKRGRPPRGQANPPPAKKNKEEEDVCFICFDGGSLVLCDRRSCPKAYHPACIKRDEAFFQSRARWDCGWHICSMCQKAAHYMCYTCTYSLCKRCTKDADYLCVRGDKGFCTTCMRTVMLLENNEQGNKEMPQVDFDDKSSWEYLFKVYWIYLKEKLSLTLTDLTQAKNPWNGIDTTGFKGKLPGVHFGTNDGKDCRSSGHQEEDTSKRRKTKEQLMILNKDPLSMEKPGSDKNTSLIGCTEWATKELLEFVAHVKNGDTSVLSQFNVQTLLLDYIKRNNLRDPRRKSQIRCDLRLKALFGKPRVGDSEMLKLLEFHFLAKEEPRNDVFIQAGVVDAVANQVEADEYNDNLLMMDKDKKCKTRRKGEDRALQTNLDQYAAIDVYNINLIYLRLNLMENLIEDNEKFHDNVVGSIVRLRISSSDQKQDMYRLVQVVGTTKVDVPYKIGNRTASVMLEVLNLDKKESISIDAISNQDFSEEECRSLRQSIRRGLVKRWTVGEIQKKAMALQAVKLKDWLETEILRLSHLCDRASEKGRKKDLRDCVEKLQLLKTPEECERRLREIPEVHSDPNYESEGDAGESNDKSQGEYVKTRYSGSSRKGSKSISQRKTDKEECATKALERVNEGKDACVSFAGNASETSTTPLSTESTPSANNSGTIKLWHYRDPSGKIQGPFSMVQLQKWNTTGIFPPDMRIWVGDIQDKSLLLTDALNGRFHKTSPLLHNVSLQSQEVGGASDSKLCNPDVEWSESMHAPRREDSKQAEGLYSARAHSAVSNELTRSGGWDPHSSDWTSPIISYCKEIQAGSGSQHVDSFMGNSSSYDKTQVHSPLLSHHGKGHEAERWNSDPNNGIWNSHETTLFQITGGQSHESQSSGQNLRPLPVNFSSINLDSNSCIVSVTKSTDSFEQNGKATENKQHMSSNVPVQDSHIPILPSPSPKTSNEDQKGQASENKQPVVPSNFPVQDSGPSWSSASRLVVDVGQLREPIEFSTLAEESVSDLLAEVDAMESQGGLASPTSVMNCGEDDLINGPKDDCFSSIDEEFSPTPDPGKSDALSSTGDIRLPHLSTITDELFGASPADVVGQSSTSGEVDGETKSTDVPVNQGEAGSHIQSSSPLQQSSIRAEVEEGETKSTDVLGDLEGSYILFTMKQDIVDASIARRAGLEAMDTGWGTMQESSIGNGVEEGEATKSADVPVNHGEAGSDSTQPAARFITSQNLVDSDVARGASSEDMVTGWRTMQQSSTKAKAEGKSKSTHVSSNNQKGSEAMDTGSRPIQQSSTRVEVEEGEIKSSDVPVSQYMIDTNIARRAESEAMDSGWGTMHGNVNLGSGRLSQGNSDMGWATSQGIIARGNANTNHGSSAGSVGRESQRRHGGERYTSPRDRAFPGGSSGFSPRGKPSWSRQSYGGSGGGGGGYSRHSPKGQRVCKFHESGHCKKGALCNYLHP